MRILAWSGVLTVLLVGCAAAGPEPLARRVVDRFVRYARVDTQSREGIARSPSSTGQLELARMLVDELKSIGVADARVDASGYVLATVPSNLPPDRARAVPTICFIAHLDTSPEAPGGPVKPIVHRNYRGGDIRLPGAAKVITTADNPELKDEIGADVVTSDGTSLLGADDKAGICAVVTAVEELLSHPETKRGTVKLAFTPDEEIDRSVEAFDVKAFGAKYGYTVDGGSVGEINERNFYAASATVTFTGRNAHPGDAKGRMVNAMHAACRFEQLLPVAMRPEKVEGMTGFIHVTAITGKEEKTTVNVLLRDFEVDGLSRRGKLVGRLAHRAVREYPGTTAAVKIEESYRDMGEVLGKLPFVAGFAREAMVRIGVKPLLKPVRGGTDGSTLSFRGLPCANLFCGEQNPHSSLEWVSSRGMELSSRTIVKIVEVWAEKGAGK
jgi:tripeptide aminopeptidase